MSFWKKEQSKESSDASSERSETLPPFFLITLAEESWKRRSALQHFHAREISPVVIDGVHGSTFGLRATNPYDYDPQGNGLFFHSSQIGCVLSHRIALSVALAHGAAEFIVCENDVLFPDNFKGLFTTFREHLPSDAEIAQLEYSDNKDKPWEPVNPYVKKIFYPFCSSCIWWTRQGAQKAISMLKPVDRPFDIMLMQRVFPFLNHYLPSMSIVGSRSPGEWPSTAGIAPATE